MQSPITKKKYLLTNYSYKPRKTIELQAQLP